MFFYALGAALYQDLIFFGVFIAVALVIGFLVFLAGKKGEYHYYSEFSKVYFWLFGIYLLIGLLGVGASYLIEARTVRFADLKKKTQLFDEVKIAVQNEYAERIKKAKAKGTQEQKKIEAQYKEDGFTVPETAEGKLGFNDNSKIPYRMIHAAEMLRKMQQLSGNYIKVPGSSNQLKLLPLAEKKNQAAVVLLNFMVWFRSLIWFGLWCLISLIPLFMGFGVRKQGTEEQIKEELQGN